ncbi:MAG: TerB family tellurite resistance protein [Merismopedia sp. SIO2A8]|nr:TerB family tellurite resistance protein [Symploca sp. SIO2B6]NET48680.1 TerB family tellurite resistance protein [Merismopedia sp. SIO2A8]
MVLQTPPPPSISPRQMNILRIATSMAWCDGELSPEEADVMLERLSQVFESSKIQQEHLQDELRSYLVQKIPLDELVPNLRTSEEKELVLRLGYEVIRASARTPDEEVVNDDEETAYNHLKVLLNLPTAAIQRIETDVEENLPPSETLMDTLARELRSLSGR